MLSAGFSSFRRYFKFQSTHNQLCIASRNKLTLNRTLAAIGGLAVLALTIGCGSTSNTVNPTSNPQVALYVFNPRAQGTVVVQFGTTTSYGYATSPQPALVGGAPIRILVAGMKGNTLYHMRAVATYADGSTEMDIDRTFTTGSYTGLPKIEASTVSGQTPQPGIELIGSLGGPLGQIGLFATDLSGNVIWAYDPPTPIPAAADIEAPKPLPNGDFVFVLGPNSSFAITNPMSIPAGTPDEVREIDLLGNTVNELTLQQLNTELAAANYNLTLLTLHHDVTVLPNGHMLVLANTIKSVVLTGQTTPTNVLGDVVVDLDKNWNPVWIWNEFDHLDVNRHPWNFPDWTHSNAIVYSPDDGNFLVSIRHQNWIVKVDYNNGAGTGNIIWHLGEGGDFTLQGGVDPTDWFYAQHGPAFTTSNTTGIFGLTVMDNGDDRMYPGATTVTCGAMGKPECYSTVPVFQINETTKTATLVSNLTTPPQLYSYFGGNSEGLANGNTNYVLCGLALSAGYSSQLTEVTPLSLEPVWGLQLTGAYAYRANRLPSLYPGVQWP